MKRFYERAEAVPSDGAHAIHLDGRPVRTPARAPLLLPTRALGDAVAGEWQAQGETVDPRSMPLTGLANAAIDRVAPDRQAFAAGLARYGESDLLCYRADGPETLVRRQADAWDPILDWARRRYDVDLAVTAGVVHRAQPPETVARLAKAVAARDAFALATLSPLVTVSGSLLIALALAEGAIDLDTAWAAAALDEQYQAEQWGADAEAAAALAAREAEFAAGKRMLDLLG
ncbi:ATP12 family chaperone protein [Allosphingosinicella indica]|uniref:Chaperone required for the assembly of the F1-ATPase n=1 Tax=Allosphingosinicella indica TaxID=941907 RepID=A0A1X7GGL2_9SPHN|nr:ATP12 family protein [Allosphingosinicella indica]SMF69510.1 Chaperone required for the assembly of the F1-ATPase [Allosphingosinicella indica]